MHQPTSLSLLWVLRLKAASRSFLIPHILQIYSLSFICFQIKKKKILRGKNFGSNEDVIEAVDGYLEDQEEGFCFERLSKLNSVGEIALRQSEIILRNNDTISVFGHTQSTGAENFLIFPLYLYILKSIKNASHIF